MRLLGAESGYVYARMCERRRDEKSDNSPATPRPLAASRAAYRSPDTCLSRKLGPLIGPCDNTIEKVCVCENVHVCVSALQHHWKLIVSTSINLLVFNSALKGVWFVSCEDISYDLVAHWSHWKTIKAYTLVQSTASVFKQLVSL